MERVREKRSEVRREQETHEKEGRGRNERAVNEELSIFVNEVILCYFIFFFSYSTCWSKQPFGKK